MVRDINRFIKVRDENIFFDLFGTDAWKNMLNLNEKREQPLINLYREQLHKAANVKFSSIFRVCSTEKRQTLYYLIHATNNLKGHNIMKNIMYNHDETHDFAYLGPNEINKYQIPLFNLDSDIISQSKDYLLKKFTKQSLSFDKIMEDVCSPWQEEPPFIEKNYREALKALEEEKKIMIIRVSSKTARGLSGDDNIKFP